MLLDDSFTWVIFLKLLGVDIRSNQLYQFCYDFFCLLVNIESRKDFITYVDNIKPDPLIAFLIPSHDGNVSFDLLVPCS